MHCFGQDVAASRPVLAFLSIAECCTRMVVLHVSLCHLDDLHNLLFFICLRKAQSCYGKAGAVGIFFKHPEVFCVCLACPPFREHVYVNECCMSALYFQAWVIVGFLLWAFKLEQSKSTKCRGLAFVSHTKRVWGRRRRPLRAKHHRLTNQLQWISLNDCMSFCHRVDRSLQANTHK